MKFSDQIKSFTDKAKVGMEQAQQELIENAKQRLDDVLGDDAALIKSIKLDTDVGKFYDIEAPEAVLDKLRAAGLVRG